MALVEHFVKGFGIVFGVTAGVIAGTLVNTLIFYLAQRKTYNQKISNLKFELSFNIKIIGDVLKELAKCRNAVNGDALGTYPGYFKLTGVIYPTAQAMFTDGSLYKCLAHDEIAALQGFTVRFNIEHEKALNDRIQQFRQDIKDGTYEKPKAVQELDFWERLFNENKTALEKILKKL